MTTNELVTHKALLNGLFVTEAYKLSQKVRLGRRGAAFDGRVAKLSVLYGMLITAIDNYVLPEVGNESDNNLTPTQMTALQERINYMYKTTWAPNWYKEL